MPTGVAQTPQQEEEEEDEDEELGEKFQFDDSEEDERDATGNAGGDQELGVSPAGAGPSLGPTGVAMDPNALYSQAMKRVSASHCQGINGGTSAGQESQTIPSHITSPGERTPRSSDFTTCLNACCNTAM